MIKKHVRRLTQHHVSKNVLKTATGGKSTVLLAEEQKQLIFLVQGGKSDPQ
jgi:hypothetical protein